MNRIARTAIVGVAGAIIGSSAMMFHATTNDIAGAPVAAAALSGVNDQDRIVSAVKHTKVSVVAITEAMNGRIYFFHSLGQQGPGLDYKGQASGSGFVYDDKGDIVTNAHVVVPPSGAHFSNLTVVFENGDRLPGRVIAANNNADLAVVRVDNYKKLPPALQLADSDRLNQGQWAIAIGEPYELQQSVTLGVISAFNRDEQVKAEGGENVYDFKGLLQTSAPINPGNSGGPLIDIDGQVIGVNQLTEGQGQGLGFAIPSNIVKRVVPTMLK